MGYVLWRRTELQVHIFPEKIHVSASTHKRSTIEKKYSACAVNTLSSFSRSCLVYQKKYKAVTGHLAILVSGVPIFLLQLKLPNITVFVEYSYLVDNGLSIQKNCAFLTILCNTPELAKILIH